ncbi:MAG: ribosome biogenesis GTPase Der [Burkholderiaceae bacterium]|nr:ribosome biogenesis GTPase Der [Burkholderiaceae bacterium]MEB2352144.1 ribosome biogenesis GTPase Der [Burkholderiaceae bacterium]
MTRLPVLALVGRPNVGKSTLFNRLTRSRAALVADVPGLTRDRQYGRGRLGEVPFIVIDSGGFEPVAKTGIAAEMARQTRQAVIEADVVVLVVDGREGLSARDQEIAAELRRTARRVVLAVNKTEGMPREQVAAEFHALGLGTPHAISSAHGDGVRELLDIALAPFGAAAQAGDGRPAQAEAAGTEGVAPGAADGAAPAGPRRVKVAVVGRPNVGKSTLINTLLGEERLIAFDQPGTTRDAVAIDFDHAGRPYTLIDTAGLRRRARVTETVEKFSIVKTLQAIEDCHVCVLLLDACAQVTDQDATIAGYILEAGRALVVAVNKWDLADAGTREQVKADFDRRLHFLRFAKLHFISAREGRGVGALMRSVDAAYAAAIGKLSTPRLTRALREAVERQPPPRRGLSRPKLRYAHQGGQNPPIVVIHGSALENVPEAYRRYLESWFRERFGLSGTPLRIEFRSAANPYAPRD